MRFTSLLLFCLQFFTINKFVLGQNCYYVNLKNDTISLPSNAFIDVHKHSQHLVFEQNGKKIRVNADTLLAAQTFESTSSFTEKKHISYCIKKVPTKNNGYCQHFFRSERNANNAAIGFSPFCSQCDNLNFYLIVNNNENAIRLTRKNFKEIVEKYFSTDEELIKFSKAKKYTPYRMSRFLHRYKEK